MIGPDSRVVEADGILSLQIPWVGVYVWHEFDQPAGSFSKDIVEVEVYRVIVTRNALARFGEEK